MLHGDVPYILHSKLQLERNMKNQAINFNDKLEFGIIMKVASHKNLACTKDRCYVFTDVRHLIRSILQYQPKLRLPLDKINQHAWMFGQKVAPTDLAPGQFVSRNFYT